MTYKYLDDLIIPPSDLPDSTASSKGIIQLAGDLNGTGTAAATPKIGQLTGLSGTISIPSAANISWAASVSSPTITQLTNTTGGGINLTITAQSSLAASSTLGGDLILKGGVSSFTNDGSHNEGRVYIYGGANEIGHFQIRDSASSLTNDCRFVVGPTASYLLLEANVSGQSLVFQSLAGIVKSQAPNIYFYDGTPALAMEFNLNASGTTNMIFEQGTSPNIKQATLTSDVATNNLTISPQAPFASATGTNRIPGSLIVNIAAPTNSGTTYGQFEVQQASTTVAYIDTKNGLITAGGSGSNFKAVMGPTTGNETVASSLWLLGTATALASSNYSVASDGTNTYINTPVGGGFLILTSGGTTSATITPTIFAFNTITQIEWAASLASPTIFQATQTSNIATNNISISPQAPFASATTTNRTAGSLVVNLAAPTNGGTAEAYFQVQRTGHDGIFMGWDSVDGATAIYGSARSSGVIGSEALACIDDGANTQVWLYGTSSVQLFSGPGVEAAFTSTTSQTTLADASLSSLDGRITIAYQTSGVGGDTVIKGGVAKTSTNTNGGSVILKPGAKDGSGIDGYVILQDSGGTSTAKWTLNNAGTSSLSLSEGTTCTFKQTTRTSDTATHDFTIAPQAPFASATTTNRNPGNLLVNLALPTNSGTTEGAFRVQRSGTNIMSVKAYDNGTGAAELIMGNPGDTNYALFHNGTLHVNSSGSTLYFEIGGAQKSYMTAATWHLTAMNLLEFDAALSTPTIYQVTAQSDVATTNLILEAQGPFASATTHKTPGNTIVNIPAPLAGTDFEGGFVVQQNGTNAIRMGYYASGTTYAGIWFMDGGSPSDGNFGFLGNQSVTYLNVPVGGSLTLAVGGSASYGLTLTGTNPATFYFGALVGTASFGTNKSGGTLAITGDAAVTGILVGNTNVQLTSGTASFGSGTGVIGITNATAVPTTNPSGGGILYSDNGALKWRSPNGVVTTIAPA